MRNGDGIDGEELGHLQAGVSSLSNCNDWNGNAPRNENGTWSHAHMSSPTPLAIETNLVLVRPRNCPKTSVLSWAQEHSEVENDRHGLGRRPGRRVCTMLKARRGPMLRRRPRALRLRATAARAVESDA